MNRSRSRIPVKINYEGSIFVHHSLGMVNRELLYELVKNSGFDIGYIPWEKDLFIPSQNSKFHNLLGLKSAHCDADFCIRHRWPPNLEKIPDSKLIVILPWEYGCIPIEWREKIRKNIDEVWVYTEFLRDCYVNSGVDENKIRVVPLGIDPLLFNPSRKPSEQIRKLVGNRFCFLFNGGAILRKGTDILVNAYLNEFKPDEPVCLVIKDSDMYGKRLAARIKKLASLKTVASVIYLSDTLAHEDLPELYTACDCYVHPYRAEGFGLPVAEALACGKPVIVTGGGACLDFVKPDMGYFINCSIKRFPQKVVSGMETVDNPFWLEPDIRHLQTVMRHVYENADQAKAKGIRAGEIILNNWNWRNTAHNASLHINRLQKIGRASCRERV